MKKIAIAAYRLDGTWDHLVVIIEVDKNYARLIIDRSNKAIEMTNEDFDFVFSRYWCKEDVLWLQASPGNIMCREKAERLCCDLPVVVDNIVNLNKCEVVHTGASFDVIYNDGWIAWEAYTKNGVRLSSKSISMEIIEEIANG